MNKLWKKFGELLNGYKGTYVILYLTKLANLFCSALLPLILSIFVDEVIQHQSLQYVFQIVLLYFVLFVLSMIFSASDIIIWQYLSNYLVVSVKEKLWNKILRLRLSTYNDFSHAELFQTLNDDVRAFVRLINQNVFPFLNAIASAGISIGLAFMIDIHVGVFILIAIPSTVILNKRWMRRVRKVAQRKREAEVGLTSNLLDISQNLTDINLLNAKEYFQNKTANSYKDLLLTEFDLNVGQTKAEEGIKLIEGLTRVAILIIVAYAVISGHITIGKYIALTHYIIQAHSAITTVFNFNFHLNQRRINIQKVFGILESEEENIFEGNKLEVPRGTVEFSNVEFGYGDDTIISDLSFTISRGEITGIIGQNGAGKSTIISLLIGLYPSYKGEISIDGSDIRQISLESLRRSVFVMMQREQLSGELTIAQYFEMLGLNSNEIDIQYILQRFSFCDFIASLDKGMSTPMEELSSGQRQRIRIAAALSSSAPILVFDEPTSMIDEESEKYVFAAFEQAKQSKTIIVITHGDHYLKYYDKKIMIGS